MDPQDTLKGRICTRKGHVVYKRPKHKITLKDIIRILERWIADTPTEEYRASENIGRIRALDQMARRLFAQVLPEFTSVTERDRAKILASLKAAEKRFNESIIAAMEEGFFLTGFNLDLDILRELSNLLVDRMFETFE